MTKMIFENVVEVPARIPAKFKNWKTNYSKEYPIEGYYKLRDYLFIELMNDNLKWNDLGRKTKNYLKTFDHIIIREIPEDYQKLRNPHY